MNENPISTQHICIEIKSALSWPDKKLDGFLSDTESKRPLSADECRSFLRSQLEKGHEYFSGCDNIKPDGSCAGHSQLAKGE